MGRPTRVNLGGYVYHVLNRANGRLRIFRKKTTRTATELNLVSTLKLRDRLKKGTGHLYSPYIIAAGCEIPRTTPVGNVMALSQFTAEAVCDNY